MRTRIFSLLVVCLVCLFPAKAQVVNETESSIVLNGKTADVSIVLENPAKSFDGTINLELLDTEDKIRANLTQNLRIKKGKETYKISVPLADLPKQAEDEIGWYRLRYRIGERSGVISLSELIKDIFDLRVIASDKIFAGMNYRVRARAVHPFTNQSVKNIKIRGELTLDVDSEENDGELKLTAKGTTNADGFAVLEFKIPPEAKIEDDGELKITGERYGLKREIEEDINALVSDAGIYINTDKPLYQPGQTLNVRGLLMKGAFEHTVVSDAELEFSIKDESDTVVFRETVKTSDFGIASVSWQIPENAKLGTYSISVEDEDGDEIGYETIKVSRYDLPQFVVKTKTDRAFYLPTQDMAEVEIRADYLFGKPVTKGKVRLVRESERSWDYSRQKWDIEEEETF
ncbi:MAG TPA: MG2 domain-containing protein, partial [Pyrinomonadaceae bacterium]|nr:MG2 domain-containing protein [Pyrinomonadaceae bacterium]